MSAQPTLITLGPFSSLPNALGQSNAVSGVILDFYSSSTDPSTVSVGSTSGSGLSNNSGLFINTLSIDLLNTQTNYRATYPAGTYNTNLPSYSHQKYGSLAPKDGANPL